MVFMYITGNGKVNLTSFDISRLCSFDLCDWQYSSKCTFSKNLINLSRNARLCKGRVFYKQQISFAFSISFKAQGHTYQNLNWSVSKEVLYHSFNIHRGHSRSCSHELQCKVARNVLRDVFNSTCRKAATINAPITLIYYQNWMGGGFTERAI